MGEGVGYLSLALTIGLTLYALRCIWLGVHRPHAFSILVWFLLSSLAFFNMWSQGVGIVAYRTGYMAFILLINFLFCLRQGMGYVRPVDWVLLILALAAVPVWFVTGDPDVALYWMLLIELIATVPTLRKAYVLPYEMSIKITALTALAQFLQMLSFYLTDGKHTLAPALYMTVFPVIFAIITLLLIIRRRFIRPVQAPGSSAPTTL